MNALELADELDKYKGIATRDAATMLREQQAEIEALKKTISSLFGGLEASLDLNKAQALRKAQEK